MNVVVPLTRPHALPRQQYDEAAVAAGDRRGQFQNPSLRALCSGQEASRRSPRHGDRVEYLASDTDLGHGWWCCMRRSGCVHRGSLMIEAKLGSRGLRSLADRPTGSEVGAARWWTEASMHRAGRRGFRRGPVTADLERGRYGLWRQTVPRSGQTCATGGSACSHVGISEGERRGRGRGEHGGCDTGGKGS